MNKEPGINNRLQPPQLDLGKREMVTTILKWNGWNGQSIPNSFFATLLLSLIVSSKFSNHLPAVMSLSSC